MFGLFRKKYWYYFYLPAELFYSVSEINTESLRKIFNKKNIIFEKIKYQKISDHLYYISICFKNEEELFLFKTELQKYKELIAPWVVFPDMFYGSPRWNQGFQKDYCIYNWLPYWKGLDIDQKQKYLSKYHCPTEWKDWLIENKMLE